jgi:hypothetical protein
LKNQAEIIDLKRRAERELFQTLIYHVMVSRLSIINVFDRNLKQNNM